MGWPHTLSTSTLSHILYPYKLILQNLLGPWCLDNLSPRIRVIKFGCKLSCEIGVCEPRREVILHILHNVRLSSSPIIPEPFIAKAWYGENSPADKDANLGLIIPGGKRSGVQRIPCRLIASLWRHCQKPAADDNMKPCHDLKIHHVPMYRVFCTWGG